MSLNIPCISVIVSVYNSEKYVGDCIKSILGQTFTDFEFIIIYDASTGKRPEIIKSCKDKRIRLLINQEKNYQAYNDGLRQSRGKYICIMNADNISLPNRFERQVLFMEQHPEYGLAGSGYKVSGQEKDLFHESNYERIKVLLLRNNCFFHSSVIIRNDLLKKYNLKYIAKYNYLSDYDFLVRATRYFPVTNIQEVLLYPRNNTDPLTIQNSQEQAKMADEISVNQLSYIGLKPDKEERGLHLQLLKGQAIDHTYKRKLDCWINKIKGANNKAGYYKTTELENLFDALLSLQPFCRNIIRPYSISKMSCKEKISSVIAQNKVEKKLTIEVLTLLSGNPVYFRQWNEALDQLDFDYPVILRILDNSGSSNFNNQLIENSPKWKKKFSDISVISYLEPYKPIDPDNYLERGRHTHVAGLYSKLFSQVKNDLVLTFEEDIIPQPDTFKRIISKFNVNSVGAIGCAYTSPMDKNVVCAAFGIRRWATPLPWILLNGQLIPVDYMGGGFTLWNFSRLSDKMITHNWDRSLGWDAVLCERIRASGLKIILAGDIICRHNNRYIK